MKRTHFVQYCLALSLVNAVGWCAEPKGTEVPSATANLQPMRDEYIRNFQRIGLNTTSGDAAFLRIVIESSRAKRGLEIGTATGYGAIFMGLGFERNGGHLTTIDIDPKMVKAARHSVEKMQLQRSVTVVEGDALKVIPKLEGHFDFVFIDAVKRDYRKYFEAVEPKLKPGAVIVADNVIKSADEMRTFLDVITHSPDYHTVIIRASEEKGDGMSISYKLR
jgi:predicted O-methyltransferase YrrM